MTGAPSPVDGVYVHVPFCSAICPYCDFSVLTAREPARRAFVGTLLAELALVDDATGPIRSLYLGGGTPSILPPDSIGRLVDGIRTRLGMVEDVRMTIEANPEDVDADAASAWRALGFDTVSLGVQSFDDASLRFLGRRHDGADATRAVDRALDAGFRTVSVDLIFGLPDRDVAVLDADLAHTIALAPQHVSCYQLTIHDGTVFGRRADEGRLREADEATQADRYGAIHRALGRAGYEAYEVSNFARAPAHRSRHNRSYWTHRPYLGLGPSAHSFVEPRRWWNRRSLEDWEGAVRAGRRPIEDDERLSPRQLTLEAVMLGLRTAAGVDLDRLERRWGVELRGRNVERFATLVREGLVTLDGPRLTPTAAGMAVADGLARSLEI